MPPLTPSETRALLDELGHRPVHKLGQNFLIDANIVRKSLELARIQAADIVVEVGPGLGTLSNALLEAGAEVYAVELDKHLAERLKLKAEQEPRFHLIVGDALDHPLAGLPAAISNYKIVANLPYAISTPWMDAVVGSDTPPVSMTLMLQKEAAARYAAKHGSKQFGGISIFLQAAYRIAGSHDVSGNCFYPRPDVGSRLLLLERKDQPIFFSKPTKLLIREVFQQRRKQFGTLLRQSSNPLAAAWLARIENLGIAPTLRPEQIALEQWIQLAR